MGNRRAEAVIPASMTGPAAAYRYSPGIRVRAGDLLLVSGQVGRDAETGVIADPEAQFTKAFENLEAVVREAGGTLADVVEITTYLTSMEHLPLVAAVKDRFFTTEPYPAWTGIGVQELALPGLLLEVKATAALR
jgi:enamine deaminase RidA (YjgF/YER057c/UK114 family)